MQMLSKMRVLSFTHFVQGPVAAQYLADLGADVIKVEPPTGAFERSYAGGGVFVDGVSITHLAVNRNKKSIAIDLKHSKARDLVYAIASTCDVVIENYRIGVLDKLGLGYDDLRKVKPDIIYASSSGWGAHGPMTDKPGQDLLVQARCGIASATGPGLDRPTPAGSPIVDQHGGALLAMGVLAAYARKLTTGEGTRVESSLLNAGLDLQVESVAVHETGRKTSGDFERDAHLGSWYQDAPYGIYQLADASVAIVLGGDVNQLGIALGSPALDNLVNDRGAKKNEFARVLADHLRTWTYVDFERTMTPLGVWFQRVQTYAELRDDPQIIENGCFIDVAVGDEKATLLAHPLRYDRQRPEIRRMPIELGGDGRQVLREAGLSEERIAELIADKVVVVASK